MADHSENDVATKKDLENLKKELKQELRQDFKQELQSELSKYATKDALEVVARQVLKNSNDIAELKVEMKNDPLLSSQRYLFPNFESFG